MTDVLQLENEKQVLKQYYGGHQIESPNGGFLMLLGIRGTSDGAIAIFECSATSMRYEVSIPKATRTERKKVKDQLAERDDAECPRCGEGNRLGRVGPDLACGRCRVAYAKA